MAKKKVGLGRNLNALLGAAEPRLLDDDEAEIRVEKVLRQIPIEKIRVSDYQPRSSMDEEALNELALSIKTHGIIQPIVARPVQGCSGEYELIAGERRLRAAKLADLEKVPVIVKDVPNQAALAMALIENIQRQELTVLEQSLAYKRLMEEFDLTHQQVSEAVGKSRTTISNLLRLLNLERPVQKMLDRGEIEFGHARALLALNGEKQIQVASEVFNKQLTVRATEKLIKQITENLDRISEVDVRQTLDPNVQYYQERLQNRLGSAVNIQHSSRGSGKVTIEYKQLSELEDLLDRFK